MIEGEEGLEEEEEEEGIGEGEAPNSDPGMLIEWLDELTGWLPLPG